jgi:cytochrome c oxidase subunit 3
MSEHSPHAAVQHPHWETSVWPLAISFGILFALPVAFAFHFVYKLSLPAVISLGVGVPLIVAGIAGWVRESFAHKPLVEGLGFPAMGWFILAEAMIFVTFFASYWFTRLTMPEWPPAGSVAMPKLLPAFMTLLLVASSFTIHAGEARLERGDRRGFVTWLLVTMALGLAFLGCSAYEWNHLFHQGFGYGTNVFSTFFFSITGFHGGHVLVGLCIFLAILVPALAGKINDTFVKAGSLYWHFVDLIWFFVVSQLYYW